MLESYSTQHHREYYIKKAINLWISSFDVVQRSLGQLYQLRVSHRVDSGGSWLLGQSLHLKHKAQRHNILFKKT